MHRNYGLPSEITNLFQANMSQQSSLSINDALLCQQFSIDPYENPDCIIRITPSYILLSPLQNKTEIIACIKLGFDIKFEVLFKDQNDISSDKIGFRLFNNQKQCPFYSKVQSKLKIWILYLNNNLNQIGFTKFYRPVSKIGKGNFAGVYQVERKKDKKKFAVKAFSKMNSFGSSNGRQGLILQMNILRKLNQKNVIKLQAIFESENSIYIILELLTGGLLSSLINFKRGKFSLQESKKMIQGILRGLKHIHQQRIMHRDLKPENILLRFPQSLDPVIVDFGLADFVDQQKYIFYRCGTPGYVAPQILRLQKSQHIEPQCDIFSAGAIFHIFLVGAPLFGGLNYQEIYKSNKLLDFNFKDKCYSKVNKLAMDLLIKMLEINPSKRIKASQALKHEFFDPINDKENIEPQSNLISNKKLLFWQ